jgi:hypothetical protein
MPEALTPPTLKPLLVESGLRAKCETIGYPALPSSVSNVFFHVVLFRHLQKTKNSKKEKKQTAKVDQCSSCEHGSGVI